MTATFFIRRPRDELLVSFRTNFSTLSVRLIADGPECVGRPEEYICPRWRMDNYDTCDVEIDGEPLEEWRVTIEDDADAGKFQEAFGVDAKKVG
jgi:hypothetical protein